MRYTFDVNCNNNENVLIIEVGFGSSVNSVKRTIKLNNRDNERIPDLNELISDMIDNIRLTVKEREEAIHNAEVFKNFVHHINDYQMIVEDGDSSVTNIL